MSQKKPDYGDPLDYPDIPPDVEFSDAYIEATTPPHVKEAIAKRKAERAAKETAKAA